MMRRAWIWLTLIALATTTLYFLVQKPAASPEFSGERIVLATTTSTYDSGLLNVLTPEFEQKYGVKGYVISVGTGQALELARRGDADLVLTHARDLEDKFVKDGYGVHRVGIMYNDFVIVGPASDVAKVRGVRNATLALQQIAKAGEGRGILFVSRADKSGTYQRELSLWSAAQVQPHRKSWYLEAGAGMGTVIRIASEKAAYVLTDRGTWIAFRSQVPNLELLVEKDPGLANPYAAILVNPEKHPKVNIKSAKLFVAFLLSAEGQGIIEGFKKGDETLFFPIAHNVKMSYELGFPNQSDELKWYSEK